LLVNAEVGSPVEPVDVVAGELVDRLDAFAVSLYITDFSGNSVVRLSTTDGEEREQIGLPGSIHGQAMSSQQVCVRPKGPGGHVQVVAPVSNRGAAIGLLGVILLTASGRATRATITEAAHALAYILVANRRFTDLYTAERWNSSRPRSTYRSAPPYRIPTAFRPCG
jgi:hypothetical protein